MFIIYRIIYTIIFFKLLIIQDQSNYNIRLLYYNLNLADVVKKKLKIF